MKFKVTYPDGVTIERDQSDCHTVEQLINCMFGSGHNLEEMGIKVEPLIEGEDSDSEEPQAKSVVEEPPKPVEPPKPAKDDLPRVVKTTKK
jgi:hypothetical protein